MEAITVDKSVSVELIACTATSKRRDQLVKDSIPSPLKAGGRSIFRELETERVAREAAPVLVASSQR